MPQLYTKLVSYLSEVMNRVNAHVAAAYTGGSAIAIWSEGGEWPSFSEEYDEFTLGDKVRDMEVSYESPGSMNNVGAFLDERFADTSVVGLTLDCGAGKSTKVISTLHSLKLGVRTIVIQPSVVVAQGLVEYMRSTGKDCVLAENARDIPKNRALVYIGVGCAFDAILLGGIHESDLVVVDEAHCVSAVHTVVMQLLGRMRVKVLLMTASTTHNIRGLRGARLIKVSGMDADISAALAREQDRAVMVGVTENQSYATPASCLIGATLDVNVIYDTGLRPEPRFKAGKLLQGERVATKLEILQMVGRVGRTGMGGTAYYNDTARAMPGEGVPLYDILLKAFRAYVGLDSSLTKDKARQAWILSGILSTVGVGTPNEKRILVPEIVETVPGNAHVEASSVIDDGEWRRARRGGAVSIPSSSSSEHTSGSMSASRGVTVLGSRVINTRTRQEVAKIKPDPQWRPFRRGNELSKSQVSSETGVMFLVDWMRDASKRGDMIIPAKFPRADASVITGIAKEEARLVLAGRMLPSFSEMETLAVVVLWNDIVDATRGPMRTHFVHQFVDYFDAHDAFSHACAKPAR
jgi:hypothetical protein